MIDLEKYGELLEDFFDIVISRHVLATEEFTPLEEFIAELEAERAEATQR
ncbi:MAG: hypothetical protein O3A46_00440 [Candidatus Poribacteria bacterium]|nr:hypothetical protein [Candidatus Poribacteria bacterium]